MAISPVLRSLFDQNVTIRRQTSKHTDGYPKPGYQSTSASKTYPAKIELGEIFIRTEHGHETVGGYKVFLFSSSLWTSSNVPRVVDKIVLPDTHQPTEPTIISIAPVSDENGINHLLLRLRR